MESGPSLLKWQRRGSAVARPSWDGGRAPVFYPLSGHSAVPSHAANYGALREFARVFKSNASGIIPASTERTRRPGEYARARLLILAFDRELVGMSSNFGSAETRSSRGLLPDIIKAIVRIWRGRRAVRYGSRLSWSTANREAAPTCNESLNERHGSLVAVELATAGLTGRGQDVHPLHHADILVIEGVAMRDKAAYRHRIEIGPKRD